MRRSNLYVGLYLFLVFLSGVVVGAISYRLYSTQAVRARNSDEYRQRYTEEMRSRLKLRDDQIKQLNVILDETRDEYRALHQKFAPDMKAVQDEQVVRVKAILDEVQRAEYKKMREERAKRQQQKGKTHHQGY